MLNDWEVSRLKDWCDENGGQWKRTDDSNRCVLNSEGGKWNMTKGEFMIRDLSYVEIRDMGYYTVKDESGEVLDITDSEWENWMNTSREDEFDNAEQANYKSEKTTETGSAGGDTNMSIWGDEISINEVSDIGDIGDRGHWQRSIQIELKKSPDWVRNNTLTQEDMWEEARWNEWENWDGNEDSLAIPGKDKESWLKQNDLWDEYQERAGLLEPKPEYDKFECPDDAEFVEVDNSVIVEGNVDDVYCSENKTGVYFKGDDGSYYSIEGSPEGWEPITLKQNGRKIDELTNMEFETFKSATVRV